MKHNSDTQIRCALRRRARSFCAVTVFLLLASAGVLTAQEPVRVSQDAAIKAAVTRVDPEYPAMARQMKISGAAEVDVTVATDGSVEKVDIVKGNAILSNAAATAAKKWKFKPFEADGEPSKAIVRLAFNFNL